MRSDLSVACVILWVIKNPFLGMVFSKKRREKTEKI